MNIQRRLEQVSEERWHSRWVLEDEPHFRRWRWWGDGVPRRRNRRSKGTETEKNSVLRGTGSGPVWSCIHSFTYSKTLVKGLICARSLLLELVQLFCEYHQRLQSFTDFQLSIFCASTMFPSGDTVAAAAPSIKSLYDNMQESSLPSLVNYC